MLLVVKVSGSLFDLPDLGPRLRRLLEELGRAPRLFVPGGGAMADVVRELDQAHALGDEASHWLALRACSLNAHFLLHLLPGARLVRHPAECVGVCVLDPFAFVRADEGRPGCLPHHWGATSDSVAGRAAALAGGELLLLKSVTLPPVAADFQSAFSDKADWKSAATDEIDCDLAAARGDIDPVLPGIVRAAGLRVRAINLRAFG